MNRVCPYCGKNIHERSSLCPYCTHILNRRTAVIPPQGTPFRALRLGFFALLCLALALSVWAFARPQTVSGFGEVIYTDGDGRYRLCLSRFGEPFVPAAETLYKPELDVDYLEYIILHVSHIDSGANAAETFMKKVENINISEDRTDRELKTAYTIPHSYYGFTDAASVLSLDYRVSKKADYDTVLTIILTMENGDTIRLSQRKRFHTVSTFTFSHEETPMSTAAELQTLLDGLDKAVEPDAVVNVLLPAVTYTQPVTVSGHSVNLIGSTGGEGRTVFAAGLELSALDSISHFSSIDFISSDGGTGVSAAGPLHLDSCTFSGWDTGVSAHGSSWAGLSSCVFDDNGVGFHLNSTEPYMVTPTDYYGCYFENNGTAVLLENVPIDNALSFSGCVFSRNGRDIDNPCGQTINISMAFFE